MIDNFNTIENFMQFEQQEQDDTNFPWMYMEE